VAPTVRTLPVGAQTLTMLECPPGPHQHQEEPDVVWWELSGTSLRERLVPHDNWDDASHIPYVGSVHVEVLGPFSGASYALVARVGNDATALGDRIVRVLSADGALSEAREFPGLDPTWVEDGVLRADDARSSDAEHDVGVLDARWRWGSTGWTSAGPPVLRTSLSIWPCDGEAFPLLDPGTGAPAPGALVVERGMALRALDHRLDVGGGPVFLIQAGGAQGWVRQVVQGCAG